MSFDLPKIISELYENGQPHNKGLDHIPKLLLFIPTKKIVYHWLITEMYKERPFIAYGLSSQIGRRPLIQEINLLPLFNMEVNGAKVMIDESFDSKQKLSTYLETCLTMTYIKFQENKNCNLPYLRNVNGQRLDTAWIYKP